MTPLFITDLLEQFGLRLGLWVAMIVMAWYIYKSLSIGAILSEWMVRFAFVLVVIAAGLASGVITGFDVGQLWGMVLAAVDVGASIVRAIGVPI